MEYIELDYLLQSEEIEFYLFQWHVSYSVLQAALRGPQLTSRIFHMCF